MRRAWQVVAALSFAGLVCLGCSSPAGKPQDSGTDSAVDRPMDLGQTPEVPTADASGAGGAAGAGGEAGTGSAGAGGEAGTGFAGAGGAGGSAAGSTGAGGSDAGAPDAVDAPVDGTVAITCPTVSTDPNAATCRTRGAACTAAGQCASGFCVDGFCCGAACDGACWSCSVGTPGICLEVKGGTDDHCDGTCNAGGGCQKRNGLTCLAGNQCASGVCHDGVCCDTDCSATCRSCVLPGKVGTCSAIVNFDDLQCPVGSSCNGQGVCARKDGGVCAVGSQCLSGFCVDNTCCGSACADACMACNLTGTVGTCAPVPTATPDAPMCTGTNTCDGAGACKKVDGQSCVNASECAGKTCVRNACCSDAYCWPLYAFTSTWGTGDYDRIYALAAAKDGGFVMAGGYQTSARSDEIALVRFNAAGTFQWSKLLGGTDYDTALGAAVLSDDSVMVGGMFASRSLDLDPGATTDVVNLATSIKSACFLSKYDAAGNYVWSRTWIASYNCQVYGVTASPVDDSVYVVAYVQGDVDLDPTAGADPRTPAAVGTAFLVKLTKDGAYLWGRLVPMELYNRVAVGPDGSVFYADGFSSTWDLDPTAGVDMRTPEGGRDAFVMKLGADGSYKWSRVFAGTGAASAEDVAVAPDGSVVVFGEFTGTATFDPAGTVTKTSTDSTDVFVTKLDASGTHQWTQAMGGPSFNEAEGVAVTAAGDIVVVGIYEDPFDLNPGPGVLIPSKRFPANNDVWVDGFSPTGAFQWGRVLPGTSTFNKASVTVLKDGGLAIGAEYHGDPDFDPGPGADGHPTTSYNDVYVTKLTP